MRTAPRTPGLDPRREHYREARIALWDGRADLASSRLARYYHRRLAEVYRHLVSPGAAVLEIGCGMGDLLAALAPSIGVGVDFSPVMLRHAREREVHANADGGSEGGE